MKRCYDCSHCVKDVTYYPSQFGIGESVNHAGARCALTDVVTGRGLAGELCTHERGEFGKCGPYAANFEAKPPERPVFPESRDIEEPGFGRFFRALFPWRRTRP